MTTVRDPVSEHFDPATTRHLARAHQRAGRWVQYTLRNPSPAWVATGWAMGVNLLGRDDVRSGTARTAWARSYIRSAYYVHREQATGAALKFRVGTVRITPAGLVLGRVVQLCVLPGDGAAYTAAGQLPESRRYLHDGGAATGPQDRYWQQ